MALEYTSLAIIIIVLLLSSGLTGPGLDKWLSLTMEEMMELYAEKAGTEVDPQEILSHVVGNMMNEAIFSRRYDQQDPQWRFLQKLSKEGAERLGALSPVNFLPWLRFAPSCRRDFQIIKSVSLYLLLSLRSGI